MNRFRQVVLLILAAALAACSQGAGSTSGPTPAALADLLTTAVPGGFTTASGGAAPLDVTSAAPSTFAEPARMRDFLNGNDFAGGYVHIYRSGEGYIELLVFQFAAAPQGRALVSFQVERMKAYPGASVQPEPEIDGAYLFTLFARTRDQPRPVFCQGLWYPLGVYAFEVLTCAPQPGDATLARSLASLQYAQDQRVLSPIC